MSLLYFLMNSDWENTRNFWEDAHQLVQLLFSFWGDKNDYYKKTQISKNTQKMSMFSKSTRPLTPNLGWT